MAFSGLAATDQSYAAVFTALSCQYAHVSDVVHNSSVPSGSTVVIPAGTDCDWPTTLVIEKSIWLRGAGKNQTIITRGNANDNDYILEFDCSSNISVELSDLAFVGLNNDDVLDNGVILSNGCQDFEVHDTRFTLFSEAGLEMRGDGSRGVVYESEFVDNYRAGYGYGVVVYGGTYETPLSLGSENAVFIEDSYFRNNRHSVASNYGSRYVLRYSTIVTTNNSRATSPVDAHGQQSGGSEGSHTWEIYNNHIIYAEDGYQSNGIGIRGGDGVVFNNIIEGKVRSVLRLTIEGGCPSDPSAYPVDGQTLNAWIWGNRRINNPPIDQGISYENVRVVCPEFFREGEEYFLSRKVGYTAYTYPHPLRTQ